MKKYYALYIPTGDVVELFFVKNKIGAINTIKDADFYQYTTGTSGMQYTFYRSEMSEFMLTNTTRKYIDKEMNSVLFELIEKEE